MLYTRVVLLVAGAITPPHHISLAAPLNTQLAHPIHQGLVMPLTILTVELEEDFGQVMCCVYCKLVYGCTHVYMYVHCDMSSINF